MNMKKIIALILALTAVFGLCACGETAEQTPSTEAQPQVQETTLPETPPVETDAPETVPADEDFVFTYNGIDIEMNAHADGIIDALGEPKSYTEEASCAFEGLDKTYYFGPFYLQTYPMDGVDYIYCLWIVDDSVETPEGLYIGAPQSAVEEALGAESFNGSNAYIVTTGNSRLSVIIDGGVVSSIQYDAVVS